MCQNHREDPHPGNAAVLLSSRHVLSSSRVALTIISDTISRRKLALMQIEALSTIVVVVVVL